jgi:hypothetical protein
MNYNLKFDVPSKYLGSEANALIAKLSAADAKTRKLSITARYWVISPIKK